MTLFLVAFWVELHILLIDSLGYYYNQSYTKSKTVGGLGLMLHFYLLLHITSFIHYQTTILEFPSFSNDWLARH